jgi:hypothetical protein
LAGQTVTGLAVLRLAPRPGRITAGRVLFKGDDLLLKSEGEMQQTRGGPSWRWNPSACADGASYRVHVDGRPAASPLSATRVASLCKNVTHTHRKLVLDRRH